MREGSLGRWPTELGPGLEFGGDVSYRLRFKNEPILLSNEYALTSTPVP
jgi:hypothetical protein